MKRSCFSNRLYRLLLCLAATLAVFQVAGFAQTSVDGMWERKTENDVPSIGRRNAALGKIVVYGLNRDVLKSVLDQSPAEFTAAARLKENILSLPAPDGEFRRFRIEETMLLAPEIAAQFPEWKTYQGYGIDDPTATARFDVVPSGFHAYVLNGDETYAIDPYQENDRGNYAVFYKKDVSQNSPMHCDLDTTANRSAADDSGGDAPAFSIGAQMRTYRLAMAATGQYTNVFRQAGDTNAQAQERALAAVVTSVNRVTGIYRRDLAINFQLVSGVNLIYPDPNTDPYTNVAGGSGDINTNTDNINTVIGTANYDIGHLFQTSDSGIAGLGVVCGTNKAAGVTGRPNPVGDSFDIDYVAHEIGHQFNQNHSFNASNCASLSPLQSSVEPGSGVTVMGYAGICGSTSNVALNSIDVFHVFNITETVNFTTTGAGAGCGTLSGTNAVPVIAASTNYSIPFNTPFSLTASATDADGDALTYNWEQNNAAVSHSTYPSSPDDDDTTQAARPLFRSYVPAANPTRTFPSLPYILNNANEAPLTFTGTSVMGAVCAGTCITGEDLPSIARAMNFRVTVRDGKGGNADAGVVVTSVNTGTPFRVTTGNTATSFISGGNRTITWNVSSTNVAPISVANVRISLSTDGGQTFPTVLAASTANDGSETVAVPNISSTQARVKVEALGNIFFDVNDTNITLAAPGSPALIAASGDVAISSESCATPNNQPDPGETLTVTLPLTNNGGSPTTNLTATLQASGGVASAVTQSYGAIAPDGSTVTRSFTFQVSSSLTCGSPVNLTFVLSDGSATFPNVTKTFQTGTLSVSLSQNFDSVTAPALPSGWTSVQTTAATVNWVTTTTNADSAPNAAFGNEPATVAGGALVSPAVSISSAGARLSFRNRYNVEDGFDGIVLEFSTNGGTSWTDIVTGGGSFASGGYTDVISDEYDSPISNRQAWSGNSGGYINTVVNLPASLNGQNVRFRWLIATDDGISITGGGSWVDGVQVTGSLTCSTGCGSTNVCRIQRRNDFNGDGATDFAVFRPSNGVWYTLTSGSNLFSGVQFGAAGDKLVPADYDGDGKTDVAVYRSGTWYLIQSSDNAFRALGFGTATDVPVAGDYTGDGKADIAVYRPSTGVWYAVNSTSGALIAVQFGGDPTDVPIVGDFDGDCRTDFAVRRTLNAATNATQYYILRSTSGFTSFPFGTGNMPMAVGDYNGDGKSDVGVVSIQNGTYFWYAVSVDSGALLVNAIQFGQTGDLVTAGDYNGDGTTEISIWRPAGGVFYSRGVTNSTLGAQQFGIDTDTPTARWYQHQSP